ncbi:hypothetical protein ABF162_23210 [Vibrio coralliilyticus]|uniref:hypothetical protein n=1 Tax=Vibrio coralliilyticus TaxID=190893 RepID=UPI0005127D47|nr:hypothetical protein [Vibrio coralliilyticus]AIS58075.1 hypothetical protein JV59_16715 [Vibrio coralliilyticus]
MSKNSKQTTSDIASLAAQTLNNPNSSAIAKALAGSALSQSSTTRQTSASMETKASKALQSSKYSQETKSLAASVLAQSNKKR